MTAEELCKVVEAQANTLGIVFTKIVTSGNAGPPMHIGTKRPPSNRPAPEPAVHAEIDGGMCIGKFSMTVDDANGFDEDGLDIAVRLKLEDAAWEANPQEMST